MAAGITTGITARAAARITTRAAATGYIELGRDAFKLL